MVTKYPGNPVSSSGIPSLSGARIVRIATHPVPCGYYEGQFLPISEAVFEDAVDKSPVKLSEAAEKVSLLKENIKPRKNLPPLLTHLRDRRLERLHYLAVSFGLTLDFFRFWRKHKFAPFYVGQIPNAVTGEHTCMVLKPLNSDEIAVDNSDEWGFVGPFYHDFRQRFRRLLPHSFRFMDYKRALSILDPKINFAESESAPSNLDGFLKTTMSPHDMKRLQAYADKQTDFHLILDLVPILVNLYFEEKLPVTLSYAQASVLLSIGLQHQNFSYMEGQMNLGREQIKSLFKKALKKFHKYLHDVLSSQIDSTNPSLS